MKEISGQECIAVSKHGEGGGGCRILRLENFEEIRKVIYAFDKLFKPALSERISNLDVYAEKLQRSAAVYILKEEEVLGLLAFYANDSNTQIAYLTQIAVQPSAQNRKIGKTLLDLCIELSKSEGMTEIRLEVYNHNNIAIRFYQKNGFEFFGEASVESMYMKRKL